MKIYKNPKRYQFQFDDHSFSDGNPMNLKELEKLGETMQIGLDVTGWLIAEDSRAYMVSTCRQSHYYKDESDFDGIWTILKVKGLVKVKCDD